MRAYVLLKVKPQYTAHIIQDLKEEECVFQANLIHGTFDCLAELQCKDLETINETVLRIRQLDGVLDSETSLVVQSWHRSTT